MWHLFDFANLEGFVVEIRPRRDRIFVFALGGWHGHFLLSLSLSLTLPLLTPSIEILPV